MLTTRHRTQTPSHPKFQRRPASPCGPFDPVPSLSKPDLAKASSRNEEDRDGRLHESKSSCTDEAQIIELGPTAILPSIHFINVLLAASSPRPSPLPLGLAVFCVVVDPSSEPSPPSTFETSRGFSFHSQASSLYDRCAFEAEKHDFQFWTISNFRQSSGPGTTRSPSQVLSLLIALIAMRCFTTMYCLLLDRPRQPSRYRALRNIYLSLPKTEEVGLGSHRHYNVSVSFRRVHGAGNTGCTRGSLQRSP